LCFTLAGKLSDSFQLGQGFQNCLFGSDAAFLKNCGVMKGAQPMRVPFIVAISKESWRVLVSITLMLESMSRVFVLIRPSTYELVPSDIALVIVSFYVFSNT
jgi:hypothetical protein